MCGQAQERASKAAAQTSFLLWASVFQSAHGQPSPPPTPRNAPRARRRACQREVWEDPLISRHDGADRSRRCGHTSPAAADTLLLRPAQMFDGVDPHLHAGWQVLVDGDRIAAPGPNVAAPAGARVIDLPGATLMPRMRRAIHGRRSLLRSAAASRSHQGNTKSPCAARWSIGSVCFGGG